MALKDNVDREKTDKLFKAIMCLESIDECYAFFEDLCTISEVSELSDRFGIALSLDRGSTYAEVGKDTGASSATVSRVKKFLTFGAGGYKLAIKRLKERKEI